MSHFAILSRSDATARAKEGSGAILRRGAAMSVSPSSGRLAHTERSQCAEL